MQHSVDVLPPERYVSRFDAKPHKLLILLENYSVALELLKKAEAYTDEGDRYRAVTYNNFACIFRRTKKLRSALSFLEKALEIEYNYLHFS